MPRCDAFSSPIISDAMRRISSGVRAPAMNGATVAARRVPVDAVERRVEEVVAQQPPRLVEDDRLLLREVDVQLRGDGDGARLALVERHRLDPPVVQVEDLLAVGREGHVRLRAGGRRQLPRDRALARGLVERPRVEVRLPGGAGDQHGGLAVGADEGLADVEAGRDEREALADVVEDDLYGLRVGLSFGAVRGVRLRRRRRVVGAGVGGFGETSSVGGAVGAAGLLGACSSLNRSRN